MQPGVFRGIENGMMRIEIDVHGESRIFSYPCGVKGHRDTGFYGFGPREGTLGFAPNLPEIGQKVYYDSPVPDGAGHLMVYVRAKEVA
jgi:hypothetical protein